MMLSRVAVILMAKYPEAGKVKTRLSPELHPGRAAAVYQTFLQCFVYRLRAMNPAKLVICFDPPGREADMREICDDAPGLTYLQQVTGDLGARMAGAHRHVGQKYERLLFLGADSPDVPAAHLVRAAELTEQVAVSLSPSEDGGFWSLGLWNQVDADALLSGIAWSSGREAAQTLANADALSYARATGDTWYDVDHYADLQRLLRGLESPGPPNVLLRSLNTVLGKYEFFDPDDRDG